MNFEKWYRANYSMSDKTFEEVVKESVVYLAMEKAFYAGKTVGDYTEGWEEGYVEGCKNAQGY